MSKKSNLSKNTLLLSICTLLNKGLMFVMVPFFSRWLTVEEYGTYDVYATYVTLLIPIITLATSNAVFRFSVDVKTIDGKKKYISNGLVIAIFNLLIAGTIILIISGIRGWEHCIPFLILLVAEVLDNYFQGFLRAIKKLPIYAVCKTITVVITALAVTMFVNVFSWGLDGILLGYALGFYVEIVVIIIWMKYYKYFSMKQLSFYGIGELVKYSYALIPNDISWWVINVSDRMIINTVLGALSNGIYAIAYKVPNLCSSVFGVFNISWQETAIEMADEKERNSYFNAVYNQMFSVLISLCVGVMSCNFILFDYIFDSGYSDGRLYTPVLITSVIFSMLSQFFGGVQISLKMPRANGFSTVIGAVVNLIAHIALVRFIGLYAAAISTLASTIVVTVIRRLLLRNKFKFSLDAKQYLYIAMYVYFFFAAYAIENQIFCTINLIVACVFFTYVNFDFIKKALSKMLKFRAGGGNK